MQPENDRELGNQGKLLDQNLRIKVHAYTKGLLRAETCEMRCYAYGVTSVLRAVGSIPLLTTIRQISGLPLVS